MKRHLFTILPWISLLLFTGCIVFSMVTWHHPLFTENFGDPTLPTARRAGLCFGEGTLSIDTIRPFPAALAGSPVWPHLMGDEVESWEVDITPRYPNQRGSWERKSCSLFGFTAANSFAVYTDNGAVWSVAERWQTEIPLWMFLTVTGCLPALRVMSSIRRRMTQWGFTACCPSRAFTILSALSLLLCVGTCLILPRSYREFTAIQWAVADRVYILDSVYGSVEVRLESPASSVENTSRLYISQPFRRVIDARTLAAIQPTAKSLGVWVIADVIHNGPQSIHMNILRVRHVTLATIFGILPLLWILSCTRQWRRARSHLCRACGYDLRATPDRCPECGAVSQNVEAKS